MSSALINDYPITFLPHLAKAIGVNEALVLQQLHYWLVNHAEMKHDGKFWIYKTYEEWQEQDFFFWSVRTVKSIFKKLGDMGLIESQKLSSNRHNRVNYYTINSVKLAEISAICEAEFEAKRLAKLAKKGGKPCTVDSANLAQSQSAESAQSQGANPAQCLREQEENNKDNKEEAQPQNSDGFIVGDIPQQPVQEVTEKMIDEAISYLVMQKLLNPFEPFNRDAIRFELINSQQYKKPAIITLANFVNKLPVNERIARFQTLAQSEIIHPSHIASAPVIDDTPKLSREEKLARIAQIERGEI